MTDSRDRVAMQFVVDADIRSVLEFMQFNVPTAKLVGIADSLPKIARLLWEHFPQESCVLFRIESDQAAKRGPESPSQSTAI
jgi:hypothetical protein